MLWVLFGGSTSRDCAGGVKGPTPKADALRAMREARYQRAASPREPATKSTTTVEPAEVCGYKARSGKTGVCHKKAGHQGRHQFKEQ